MTDFKGKDVSFTGGISVRPHAVITVRDVFGGMGPLDDPELAKVAVAGTDVDIDHEVSKQAEQERFAAENNRGPTICLSTGYYLPHPTETDKAVWAARLGCGSCEYSQTANNLSQLKSEIPDECQNDEPRKDCPMFRGKMRADYERAMRS